MIQKLLLALCICAPLFCAIDSRLIILSPEEFAADYETAQIFFRDTLVFEPINGTMVLVPRGSEDLIDVQGKIALISIRLPHEQTIRNLQNRGAIAVVMGGFTGVPGFVMYTGDNGDTSDIVIPMVELADENWQLLVPTLNSSVDLSVIVTAEEGNAWRDVLASPWMYVIQISIGLLALSCIIVASIQLHRFVKNDDGKLMFHIPQVCLLLNILSNLERLVMIVDPQGTRQVYDRLGNTIMVLLHVPLTLIPCLLVTFYWHEILNRQSIIINRGIKKARIPFIILSVFIFAFEITFSTLRGLDLGLQNLMLIIMVILYIVVSVGISIFYFITSIRVLLRMKSSTRTRHIHMKRTTKRIVITSACLVFFCVSLIMLAPLAQFPVGFAFDLWFVVFSCASLSMSNILSFTPPPKSISSVSSGKTQKKSVSDSNPGMTLDTLPTDTTAESKA